MIAITFKDVVICVLFLLFVAMLWAWVSTERVVNYNYINGTLDAQECWSGDLTVAGYPSGHMELCRK